MLRGDQIKLLLLDEATSALDTHNEQIVHAALDRFVAMLHHEIMNAKLNHYITVRAKAGLR